MTTDKNSNIKRLPSKRIARRRARIRDTILNASSELFSRTGLESVRFEDIANAADVARGTLYSFFKNKEALLEELINELEDRMLKKMEDVRQTEPARRLEALLNLYCDIWEKTPNRLMTVHQILQKNKKQASNYFQRLSERMEDLFSSIEDKLRSNDSHLSFELFSITSIPSLQTFGHNQNTRYMFIEHFTGLLLKPAPH